MREILFRGKRKDNGEWVEGYITERTMIPENWESYMGWVIESKPKKLYDYDLYEVIPETIGQYTGMRDKNGVRIFEGDIVRQDYSKTIRSWYDPETLGFVDSECVEGHHVGVVRISAHKGVGMRNPVSYDDIEGTKRKVKRFVNLASYRCEVIGNIHDNPELLEGA